MLLRDDVVEFQELLGGEFLGADGGGVVQQFDGFLDFLLGVGAAERVGEGFALLGEGGADEIEVALWRLEGIGARREEHGGAIHVGLWRKVLGPDFPEDLRVGVCGDENGKAPVCFGAGGGANAFGNFQLDHSHEALRQVEARHDACDDGGGNIVGKVSGEPRLSVICNPTVKIEFENVAIGDVEVREVREFVLQKFHTLFVDFYGGDVKAAGQHVFCEGAVTGADFQNGLASICGKIARNHLRGWHIQKVLPEFSPAVSIHGGKYRKVLIYFHDEEVVMDLLYLSVG